MLIACDVDNVVAGLYAEWFARYNADYNDDLSIRRVTSWSIEQFVRPECGRRIFDYLKAPDLYDAIQPIDRAQWGIERIRELGHEVIFATSCHYGMVDQKVRWLERHRFCLPPTGRRLSESNLLPDDVFIGNVKKHIGADLLIDDASHTVRDWIMDGKLGMRRAILFQYPQNADLDLPSLHWQRCGRAADWPAIVEHIERMSR